MTGTSDKPRDQRKATRACPDTSSPDQGGTGRCPADSSGALRPVTDGGRTNRLQEWTVYLATLFGIAGFGLGLMWVVLDAIDQGVFEANGSTGTELAASVATLPLLVVLPVVAVFVGAWVGRRHRGSDIGAVKAGAAGVGGGTALAVLITFVLVVMSINGVSLSVGGLLTHAVVAAVFSALLAAGGVSVTRNRQPSDLQRVP